jgi:threonine dehydrogenase-like Zn-dependent dehydrogenase
VRRLAAALSEAIRASSPSSSALRLPARKSRPGRSNWSPAVWKGTAFGGVRGRTDVPKIVDWYMEGKIEIDPIITHTMPLADINKGFDLMHEGKSIRSVVVY